MAVFRVERNTNYTTMSNYHLRDGNLSLKAKGLLSVFLSLPDEWHYSISGLMKITKEGRDCLTAVIRELEKAGYLVRRQIRHEDGKIGGVEYVIYEKPQAERTGCCGVQIDRKESDTPANDTSAPAGQEKPAASGGIKAGNSTGSGRESDLQTADAANKKQMPVNTMRHKPAAEKPISGNPEAENPMPSEPIPEKPSSVNPMSENPPGIITNELITDRSNTKQTKDRDAGSACVSRRYGLYGNVILTDADMEKLRTEFPSDYDRRIEELSEYMASKGRTYKNHLATIRSWARRDAGRSHTEKPVQRRPYNHDMYRYKEGDSL